MTWLADTHQQKNERETERGYARHQKHTIVGSQLEYAAMPAFGAITKWGDESCPHKINMRNRKKKTNKPNAP